LIGRGQFSVYDGIVPHGRLTVLKVRAFMDFAVTEAAQPLCAAGGG